MKKLLLTILLFAAIPVQASELCTHWKLITTPENESRLQNFLQETNPSSVEKILSFVLENDGTLLSLREVNEMLQPSNIKLTGLQRAPTSRTLYLVEVTSNESPA